MAATLRGGFSARAMPDLNLLISSLSAFAGSIRSVREPLERAVDEVIRPRIAANFAGEQEVDLAWDQLRPATIRKRGSAHPILQHTGALKRVALQKNIWQIDGQSGSAAITGLPGVEYGYWHDIGTEEMAQRRFIAISDEDIDAIQRIFEEYLEDRINAITAGGIAVRSVLGR